jgi:predicted  nucleic acid-binding Zn-ribbon protein
MTTEEKIAKLETRIDNLAEAHAILTHQLAQAHVEQWQARIDDLEVQLHLGTTAATDKFTALTEELQSRWTEARKQLGDARTTTNVVVDTVWAGLESAYSV